MIGSWAWLGSNSMLGLCCRVATDDDNNRARWQRPNPGYFSFVLYSGGNWRHNITFLFFKINSLSGWHFLTYYIFSRYCISKTFWGSEWDSQILSLKTLIIIDLVGHLRCQPLFLLWLVVHPWAADWGQRGVFDLVHRAARGHTDTQPYCSWPKPLWTEMCFLFYYFFGPAMGWITPSLVALPAHKHTAKITVILY